MIIMIPYFFVSWGEQRINADVRQGAQNHFQWIYPSSCTHSYASVRIWGTPFAQQWWIICPFIHAPILFILKLESWYAGYWRNCWISTYVICWPTSVYKCSGGCGAVYGGSCPKCNSFINASFYIFHIFYCRKTQGRVWWEQSPLKSPTLINPALRNININKLHLLLRRRSKTVVGTQVAPTRSTV